MDETEVTNIEPARVTIPETVSPTADMDAERGAEINELLRVKQSRRMTETKVPCPSCGVVVEMTISRCPFCESDIAAETALARETTRRLRELTGALNLEHATRLRVTPKPRGFFARLKCLFTGDPAPEPINTFASDPTATRLLGHLAPGDAIRVIGEDGAWLQVKTPTSEIGWVYSTFKKK
jgi:predicted RNA-binding Zn-ribbon protein involved in translation (DUF1610 family)